MTARLDFPATERNRAPILGVLRAHLPAQGAVLEIASGSGQHAVYFAKALPALTFCPSDPDAASRASIDAWAAHEGVTNLRPALALDVMDAASWPGQKFEAVLCINMIHVSPWAATPALMAGATRALAPGGVLYLYGPYKRQGAHTAPSNAAFDGWLKGQNSAWGLRDLEAVTEEAERAGLKHEATVQMPANNLSLVFRF